MYRPSAASRERAPGRGRNRNRRPPGAPCGQGDEGLPERLARRGGEGNGDCWGLPFSAWAHVVPDPTPTGNRADPARGWRRTVFPVTRRPHDGSEDEGRSDPARGDPAG